MGWGEGGARGGAWHTSGCSHHDAHQGLRPDSTRLLCLQPGTRHKSSARSAGRCELQHVGRMQAMTGSRKGAEGHSTPERGARGRVCSEHTWVLPAECRDAASGAERGRLERLLIPAGANTWDSESAQHSTNVHETSKLSWLSRGHQSRGSLPQLLGASQEDSAGSAGSEEGLDFCGQHSGLRQRASRGDPRCRRT